MRRMLVHAGQLPTTNGNCQPFDEVDEDNLQGIYTLSDSMLDLERETETDEREHLEIWEVTCIGYLAG